MTRVNVLVFGLSFIFKNACDLLKVYNVMLIIEVPDEIDGLNGAI